MSFILFIVLIIIVFWFFYTYNKFVALKNRVMEAWSDIDVQLKRRYNLIPNLVETVKGYASHEKSVFENVTKARTQALEAEKSGDIKGVAEAENFLTSALKTLFAVAENYPDLKASQNFLELQRELRDAEDKIQAARRFYNATVMEFNTKLESLPDGLIGRHLMKLKPFEFFEIAEEEKAVPQVNFESK
ncbi:hypothetical protein HRbin34_00138 [bacterium HR34]|nr:hypothetical protein HRbin34_00138 [bacterium HR34]